MTEIAAFWANIATALGIPSAIIVFLIERHRDRRDRELETFRELSSRYNEYLQVLLEHPELSSSETEWSAARGTPSSQDLVIQMAVNLIETAYFLYEGHRSAFRRAQWAGWDEYLRDWCSHPAFVAQWPDVVAQYDEDFRRHVYDVYRSVHVPTASA